MKTKAHKPTSNVHLDSDDYELVVNQVQETLDAPMTTIVIAHIKMKSALDLQIAMLKSIMERASQIQLMTQIPSTYGSPRGDSPVQGCTHIICIFPTSVKLPPGVEVEHAGFIKVDLARIPLESLQMIQAQVNEELREHELITYAKNKNLQKEKSQLQLKYKTISAQLAEKEVEESALKKVVANLCVELPTCNIDPKAPLLQIVRLLAE